MAAAVCTNSEETESYVTCSVCLCEFDGEFRKPKFLPCAHTICLKCLKEIHKEFVIICPLCRKEFSYQDDVACLPNNPYALHLLKLTEKSSKTPASLELQGKKPAWCLTCGTLAKTGCSIHPSIEITAKTLKNFELLLNLRDDLKKMLDHGQTKLALAIEKRKEIRTHFLQLSKSLKLVMDEVSRQEEQNNLVLVEMISQLEANSPQLQPHLSSSTSVQDNSEHLLSELMTLVDGSTPEDSFEILKEKMKKSIQSYERKLADAVAMAKSIMYQKKSIISVCLTDSNKQPIPTWGLLETGFSTYWPNETNLTPTKRDLLLLSHIVFSIQKREQKMNKQTDNPDMPPRVKVSTTKLVEPSVNTSTMGLMNAPLEKFDPSKSKLIIDVRQYGTFKGAVHIKLLSSCNSPFMQHLGKICFHSPMQFSDSIGKTLPDVFLLLPAFKDLADFSSHVLVNVPPARHYMEAGISAMTDRKGWNLVFVFRHFEEKKNEMHVKTIQPILIGHVTQGIDVIEMLSRTAKNQRSGYTFIMESR